MHTVRLVSLGNAPYCASTILEDPALGELEIYCLKDHGNISVKVKTIDMTPLFSGNLPEAILQYNSPASNHEIRQAILDCVDRLKN